MNGDQMPDADGEQYILPDYQAAIADSSSIPPMPKPADPPPAFGRPVEVPTPRKEESPDNTGGYFGSFGGA